MRQTFTIPPLLALVLLAPPLNSVAANSGTAPPNLIILFADDISARELPLYGSSVWSKPTGGDTTDMTFRAQTPVLDKLAERGCWIETAWASVVCSPSRAMMMTGRYAHRHKWWNNKDKGKYRDPKGKLVTWPLYASSQYNGQSMTIGQIAQRGGYATFWSGKTQMAGDLQKFGFDEGCFTPGNLSDTDNPYTDFKLKDIRVNGEKVLVNADTEEPVQSYKQHGWYWMPHVRLMNRPGSEQPMRWWPDTDEARKGYGLNTYGPDVELDFAFDFMQRKHDEHTPFFIYHTSHLGHDAYDWLNPASKSKWPGTPVVRWNGESYERTPPDVTGDRGVYDTHGTVTSPGIHQHVNYLDYQVWLYLSKIEELGIQDNTIFVFCADNGTSGYGKNSGDRQKGTHVPLIVYAPGMTKHGRQNTLVNLSDFLPTIAELANVPLPEDYEINGTSLLPFLMTDQSSHRNWIYGYRGSEQIIRSQQLLKDGRDHWWDVSSTPSDLISFRQIKNFSQEPASLQKERDRLDKLLPQFNLHATEHDAPGINETK